MKTGRRVSPEEITRIISSTLCTFGLHSHADPDCLASAYALQRRFGGSIWAPGGLDRSAMQLQRLLSIQIGDSPQGQTLVVVDTPDISQFSGEWKEVLLIDHHPSTGEGADYFYIDTAASSCSEIVLSMVGDTDVPSSIALLSGILHDTGRLKRGSPATLRSCALLLEKTGMDMEQLLNRISTERDASETVAVLKGLERMRHTSVSGLIIGWTQVSAFESSVASAMLTAGCSIAFVASQKGEHVRLSARGDGRATAAGVNLNELVRLVSGDFGGKGGGHQGAAVMEAEGDCEAMLNALVSRCSSFIASSAPV